MNRFFLNCTGTFEIHSYVFYSIFQENLAPKSEIVSSVELMPLSPVYICKFLCFMKLIQPRINTGGIKQQFIIKDHFKYE